MLGQVGLILFLGQPLFGPASRAWLLHYDKRLPKRASNARTRAKIFLTTFQRACPQDKQIIITLL